MNTPPSGHIKTAIVLATYNELPNLEKLLPQLLRDNPDVQIIVVDDNSPDGTPAMLDVWMKGNDRLVALVRAGKLGYGTAILAGLELALEMGAGQVVTLDADYSHNPADIPELLEGLRGADVAIGSRYAQGVRVLNWQISRLLLSLFANRYLQIILGMPVQDITSGFRAYNRTAVEAVLCNRVRSVGYSFLAEVLYILYLRRLTIVEVPIIYTERREGQSKMGTRVIGEAVFRPWMLRFGAVKFGMKTRKREQEQKQ